MHLKILYSQNHYIKLTDLILNLSILRLDQVWKNNLSLVADTQEIHQMLERLGQLLMYESINNLLIYRY